MEDEDDAVEDNLVAYGNIPVSNKVRVLIHAFRVGFEVIVGDEDGNKTFERDGE